MVPTGGEIRGVDPYCTAYNRIFHEISDRLNSEMADAMPFEMMPFKMSGRRNQNQKPGIMTLMRHQVMKDRISR
jgi:uncharacterized protein